MIVKYTILIKLIYLGLANSLRTQDLGGKWIVSGSKPEITIDATVPGGIYSDLMKNGEIDDIFHSYGDSAYQWVSLDEWSYRSSFTVDDEFLNHQTVNVVFEGLDTFATILINGIEIGQSNNMFVRYIFNVKEHLQAGENDIEVRFSSPVTVAADVAENLAYVIPPDCPPDEYRGVCHVNKIRKMQSSFGFSWAPSFPSVGIWCVLTLNRKFFTLLVFYRKDVYLEAFNTSVMRHVVATPILSESGDFWNISIALYFGVGQDGRASGEIKAKLSDDEATTIYLGIDESADNASEVLRTTYMTVSSESVERWWPNGYGNQNLYNLIITFTNDEKIEEKIIRLGFRTIKLVQDNVTISGDNDTTDITGLSFYFEVNGIPIFGKGANTVPLDILPERSQNRETVRNILQTAKDSNMNMLRIRGNGVYESDYFYELADEFGILIWQDLMFASATYPANAEFLENVVQEIRHQVKRLASHPCIALWNANADNEAALVENWFNIDNCTQYSEDYVALYVTTIKTEILAILPSANYIPSSPTNGLRSQQENYLNATSVDPLYGDVSFYDYESDSWDPATFPVPRFASAYGYQSMPAVDSWLTATTDIDHLNPDSAFMDHRQHLPNGTRYITDLIDLQLPSPNQTDENYHQIFFYYSQIIQAQSVKIETEHYRSFKGRLDEAGQGNTMGALYSQLNDVWVAPTFSGMDYTGRWKMLQYFSVNFFSPVIITAKLINDSQMDVYVVSDDFNLPNNTIVTAIVSVFHWGSFTPVNQIPHVVNLNPFKAINVASINTMSLLLNSDCGEEYEVAKTNCFFYFELINSINTIEVAPSNYLFPEKLKNCNVTNANVMVTEVSEIGECCNSTRQFNITLTTNGIALFVWLDAHNISGRFSENGFLQVTVNKTVQFTSKQPISKEDLVNVLTVTHLFDKILK
ncbi:beta-mannosidase-like [Asbolus verrucosus]|uniref:beta-mannosidase n=1 Tax=Asbolus verrucosus TaxID=1661398 RepID=A0A482W8Z6_ASBVE|nr:beta-mannosidase-like [Asbolus verrucosus]